MSDWCLMTSFNTEDDPIYSVGCVKSDFMYIKNKSDALKMVNAERMYDLLSSMLQSHDNRSMEIPSYYVRDIESILNSCDE